MSWIFQTALDLIWCCTSRLPQLCISVGFESPSDCFSAFCQFIDTDENDDDTDDSDDDEGGWWYADAWWWMNDDDDDDDDEEERGIWI